MILIYSIYLQSYGWYPNQLSLSWPMSIKRRLIVKTPYAISIRSCFCWKEVKVCSLAFFVLDPSSACDCWYVMLILANKDIKSTNRRVGPFSLGTKIFSTNIRSVQNHSWDFRRSSCWVHCHGKFSKVYNPCCEKFPNDRLGVHDHPSLGF